MRISDWSSDVCSSDLETGVRGWAMNGANAALVPYRAGQALQPRIVAELRQFADLDPELGPLIERQDELAKEWVKVYAERRFAAGPGTAGYDPQRFLDGKALIDELREVNARIDTVLGEEAVAARELGQRAYRRAIIAVVVFTLLAGTSVWTLVSPLGGQAQHPPKDLDRTGARLAPGQPDPRENMGGRPH